MLSIFRQKIVNFDLLYYLYISVVCYVRCPWSHYSCHFGSTDTLPYSIRILLESAIRNCDNFQVMKADVEKILDWEKTSPKQVEIPFKPARVILQVRRLLFNKSCTVTNWPPMDMPLTTWKINFLWVQVVCANSTSSCASPGFHGSASGCGSSCYARRNQTSRRWSKQDQSFGE